MERKEPTSAGVLIAFGYILILGPLLFGIAMAALMAGAATRDPDMWGASMAWLLMGAAVALSLLVSGCLFIALGLAGLCTRTPSLS